MSQSKKILVSIPESLLAEIKDFIKKHNLSQSELVREAMKCYIKEKDKEEFERNMKKGYQEMAEINLSLAEMCFEAENEISHMYEEKYSECENSAN